MPVKHTALTDGPTRQKDFFPQKDSDLQYLSCGVQSFLPLIYVCKTNQS